MLIGERIKRRRQELGMSQKELANLSGYSSRATICKIENGRRNVSSNNLNKLANALNVSPGFLLTGDDIGSESYPANIHPLPRTREWVVLGATACGDPLHREVEETITAPDNINADLVFRCDGDSMIEARIQDGDYVFIKQNVDIADGQIGVVRIGDEYTLKRIYRGDNFLQLVPANPLYPPRVVSGFELEDCEIVGRAVAFLSNL